MQKQGQKNNPPMKPLSAWNPDDYETAYGKIVDASITGYFKYCFNVSIDTDKGYTLDLSTGGDIHDIYRYDPCANDWDEHVAAVVQSLEIVTGPEDNRSS